MKFPAPLIHGTLIKRYKRFMADVELENDEIITAHCVNSGSMLGVKKPGSEVWISTAKNPKRKLRYTWELIRVNGHLVGINTLMANGLVEEAVKNNAIPELCGYESIRREVKYGQNSRIDLLLEDAQMPTCYVEVKNVTLKRNNGANMPVEFPDAVTSRGSKHLMELSNMAKEGKRAVMLFLAQREDSPIFSIASDIDPVYADNLKKAIKAGVEVLCYKCKMSLEGISVSKPVPLNFYSKPAPINE